MTGIAEAKASALVNCVVYSFCSPRASTATTLAARTTVTNHGAHVTFQSHLLAGCWLRIKLAEACKIITRGGPERNFRPFSSVILRRLSILDDPQSKSTCIRELQPDILRYGLVHEYTAVAQHKTLLTLIIGVSTNHR
ncbi:hypothetical protein C8Q78DRAFT_1082479 [Trametes maxima]|nr:hypothetical protein C8Q78DRAFT_1082479 [Trametes maxima]